MEREQGGDQTAATAATAAAPLPNPLFPVVASEPPLPSPLFPSAALEPQPSENGSASGWLRNVSFTADLSVIEEKASASRVELERMLASSDDDEEEVVKEKPPTSAYELIPEDGEEREEERGASGSDSDREGKRKRKRKRRKKQRKGSSGGGGGDDYSSSRKSTVRVSADSYMRPTKDYYVDTHGDRDNLAYGSLYKANVPRYRSVNVSRESSFDPRGLYRFDKKGSLLNRDADVDALDTQIRSGGRYWSAKYVAVERHKNLKRLRFVVPKQPSVVASDDFIPLSDNGMPGEGGHCASFPATSIIEESWEDEVLRKTREFNRLTREHPQDEKLWLEFAEFQDKVASKQPQKGTRLQTLEKKISILENAVKLNPESEDLLIYLLKAYQSKNSTDVLNDRWEKVLMHHSGSYKLWKEYLGVVQGEFSRFKVSDMRKMYSHAIQALSAMRNKHCRQDPMNQQSLALDSTSLELELALIDVFFSLCQFEWQAGYHELATSLIQAEIEFSLFCPSLNLSERSKLRLFEHFWNNGGPRVGEEEAVGWSSWLEKEEENRQRIVKEQSSQDDDKGGWTSWSLPLSKGKEDDGSLENLTNDVAAEELQEELEDEDANQEDDTKALLKQLGIDVDASAETEIKDPATWTRWSEEELSRDYNQWMPVHPKSDGYRIDANNEETSLREILFEDVCDYLFSLSSREAQLSLLSRLVDFFGGEISQRICTNSSSWSERIRNLDALPNSIIKTLREVDDVLLKTESNSRGICDEFLFNPKNDHSNRADMMKFLRNAVLLCLREFPRNHVLEEALLIAEERSVTKTNSSAAFRPLAKSLLKSDRQDMLLCGVYAKREALAGNIDHARRAFDMALSSVEGLSIELRSNAPLLYLWYVEAELANRSGGCDESSSRVLHILSSLGSGTKYSPYECKPSNLQLLRAHQGFKERLRMVQSAWVRGAVDDQSIALVCSAALFEELATGWTAGIKVLDEAFNMVLPERRSNDGQLEFLFSYYVRMLLRHQKQSGLPKVWKYVLKGLQIYPFSSELFKNLLEVSHLCTTPNKVRLMFDEHFHKKPSVIVCVFALLFEMRREGSIHRIHGLFEKALTHERLRNSVILWRMYIAYEISVACNPQAARRVFFRAIHACPWSKKLWLDGFLKLSSVLTAKELSDLQEVMRDKELNLRTDIYEILLQDDIV